MSYECSEDVNVKVTFETINQRLRVVMVTKWHSERRENMIKYTIVNGVGIFGRILMTSL